MGWYDADSYPPGYIVRDLPTFAGTAQWRVDRIRATLLRTGRRGAAWQCWHGRTGSVLARALREARAAI